MPEVRKQIFLATKDHVRSPGQMVKQIDKRLAALGTDYIDLLFFHGLGSDQVDWPKSKEMKEAVEAIKKTGKVKFVGFSTHDRTEGRADPERRRGRVRRRDHARATAPGSKKD